MTTRDLSIGAGILGAWIALLLVAAVAPAAAADPAAPMYQPGTVDVIELTLSQQAVEALEDEPDEYQPGTFALSETDGTPAHVGPPSPTLNVEVRLKGTTSFRPLSGKAALKIKFKKSERFLGLKKMTLNNMVQDPSMIHEALAYAAFRAAGVPAPRTGFAYLHVNGEDFGLELNVETIDDLALEKLFGSFDSETQHLYEGENGTDVSPGSAPDFEVDEGEEDNVGDLEALIAAVGSPAPPAWSTRVTPFADLQEMTRMWAVEKYVGQWDGYSGEDGNFQPNNYFLYSDPSGRFQMLPWGLDETWQEGKHLPFDGSAGLLFDDCLGDAACAAVYWESLKAAQNAIGALNLEAMAAELAQRLEPWQTIEHGNFRHEYTLGEIQTGVVETEAFIASRPAEASAWLAAHVPPPAQPSKESPEPPIEAPVPSPRGPAATLPGVPTPAPRVGRAGVIGRFLTTQVHLAAAGEVSQRVTAHFHGEALPVCTDRARATAAGSLVLRCRVPAAIRRKLEARWLRFTIVTELLPDAGTAATATRQVRVPRG